MTGKTVGFDEVKRKIRRLKKLERVIRYGSHIPKENSQKEKLVWNSFFGISGKNSSSAKYSINKIAQMSEEEYKNLVEEYFTYVYYEFYKENSITGSIGHNPEILSRLSLPFDASDADIKRRFRELAKKFHPDNGGDAAEFIKHMENYRSLRL